MEALSLAQIDTNSEPSDTGLPKGFAGRLTKGAGTHLASWLQESSALSVEEGQALLDSKFSVAGGSVRGQRALAGLFAKHGKKAGHTNPITDVCYSGDILVSKDSGGMKLWRASGDFALLRCLAAKGSHVAIHECGQFIVTGTRGREVGAKGYKPKVWGPAGGSAFAAGKKSIAVPGIEAPAAKARVGRKASAGLAEFIAAKREKSKAGTGGSEMVPGARSGSILYAR